MARGETIDRAIAHGGQSQRRLLRLCVADYDRTRPLADGSVTSPRLDLHVEFSDIGKFCLDNIWDRYDACEMSLSWYVMARERGEPLMALPIFPLRMMIHAYLFRRRDGGISEPRDLVGKRVGVLQYRLTMALWARGILQQQYGVRPEEMFWITEQEETPEAGFQLPASVQSQRAPAGRSLEEMLVAGEIEALISPTIPRCWRQEAPSLRRLFPDARSAFADWVRATGIFPITHTVVVSQSLIDEAPWIAGELLALFQEAKQRCAQAIDDPKRLSLASAAVAMYEERRLLGDDPWAHGLRANRHVIQAFVRFARQQGYINRELSIEELFAPCTLDT